MRSSAKFGTQRVGGKDVETVFVTYAVHPWDVTKQFSAVGFVARDMGHRIDQLRESKWGTAGKDSQDDNPS